MKIVPEHRRVVNVGERIGEYTIIGLPFVLPLSGKRRQVVVAECDCGNVFVLNTEARNEKRSCGCGVAKAAKRDWTKHGQYKTRLYSTWQNMKGRCHRQSHTHYRYYGAKGIAVCNEWRESFGEFREWSMANGYTNEMTIDRIDNERGYEPGNCRWVTMAENLANRRYPKNQKTGAA